MWPQVGRKWWAGDSYIAYCIIGESMKDKKDFQLILSSKRLSQTLQSSKRVLTLLDFLSRSIWVGLSLHICLKLNTALLLYHASWLFGTLSDYTMAKTSIQILTHTTTDLRQQRQIVLIARPAHHSYIRPISRVRWRELLCGGLPQWRNWFGPYVFCRIIHFICCWGYELLLLLSRTYENRAVLCCLHYDILHFWLLWEKDKTKVGML